MALIICVSMAAKANDDDNIQSKTNSWTAQNSRFGVLDLLDHRSGYYNDSFPQPLLVDDTSLEETEIEFNYLHTAGADKQRTDIVSAEAQKSFGVFTFELEVPYEKTSDSDDSAKGLGNIELSARSPIFQYVTAQGWFDSTLGVSMSVGIPAQTQISKYTELEPSIFEDLQLGKHFTIQTIAGYDVLVGGGRQSGVAEIDYAVAFAYAITRADLRLPGIVKLSPLLEVNGDYSLNKREAGQNDLLGDIGFRVDFQHIREIAPSFAIGYVFPITNDARNEVHWGIVTNITFEF